MGCTWSLRSVQAAFRPCKCELSVELDQGLMSIHLSYTPPLCVQLAHLDASKPTFSAFNTDLTPGLSGVNFHSLGCYDLWVFYCTYLDLSLSLSLSSSFVIPPGPSPPRRHIHPVHGPFTQAASFLYLFHRSFACLLRFKTARRFVLSFRSNTRMAFHNFTHTDLPLLRIPYR